MPLAAEIDPILIFLCGLGVGGAAMSTVISEYVVDVVLDSRNSSMEAER